MTNVVTCFCLKVVDFTSDKKFLGIKKTAVKQFFDILLGNT